METFNVGQHYQVIDVIGEGAYGVVVSAVHVPSQRKVAIKKITPFDHSMFCLRTLREIKLLRHFQHENIISILDLLRPASFEDFKEVYLVQELMETDMHRVIRTQDLTDDHCQYFIYQTLRALKALHSANVLHRDLKPSNLLLNANCDLKLCDFGLARSALPPPSSAANDASTFMTEYVATRWYRAPEVMLTFKEYTRAIDIWSVGCVLAEMLSGKPLFPGRDYHHQLSLILEVLGTPSLDDFYAINSARSREYIRALPFRKKKNFAQLFPNANPLAVDLLEKCLTFNPKRRIDVDQALAHAYLEPYHDAEDEPSAPPLDASFFDFDNGVELPKEQLKVMIYEESRELLDISGYYNNIDHDILVRITEKMGFPPEYSGWLSSYLTDRKACFRINGEIGNFFDLANRGVPQGSPLSPVFSSLFTAPLLHRLRSDGMNIRAYIDDIMILTTATSQEGCVSNLIDDIHDLTDALGDFGLSAEMSKTELIHFARTSHCMTKNLPVRLGDRAEDIVHPSEWVRWLGFFLDRRLNFKTHIERLATRAKSMLGGMKMLGNTIRGLTVFNARALINACLMPILTYGFALWFHGRNSKSLCKILQTVQNMACRWATGSFRTAPTAVLEHVIALPPIQFRLRKLCVNYASKLRHVPANSQVNARLPPAFDSHRPDVAHPSPLSPINAIAAYTHPQAEFRTPYLMLPWEGIRHLPDRVSLITREGRSDKAKEAYIRAIKDRIANQDSDPKSVVLFTDGSSIVKNGPMVAARLGLDRQFTMLKPGLFSLGSGTFYLSSPVLVPRGSPFSPITPG
ncbi:Mitogen activated protein kinase [Ceratobasidium theobromae]|uniref:Mitogen-activated protein kinase n=1 Tax=Ceratobasidium theobromae TaxID=1582974 RepID=A0A5N5QGH1_9AGAM|nr:Mitogen activated protein kinase [Ceratobasidium theobromae]